MGAMTVSVNYIEISLDTRDIPLTSGTQIVIRADLTEPQKAGGDGNESERKDNDVTLVLVQGVFTDDTRRTSLLLSRRQIPRFFSKSGLSGPSRRAVSRYP